jgi:Domain of unknown function (DUF2341)
MLCLALLACGRLGYDAAEGDAGGIDAPNYPDADVQLICRAGSAYSRPVVVHNDGIDALADFQVNVVVDTGALVGAGKMQASCADVRFVDASGAALPYWLESGCGTASTSFWVRVPTLAPGATALAMTYGDAAAISGSDGAGVFLYFDDFDDGDVSELSPFTVREDPFDGPYSQAASSADAVSPAYSLELRAQASCFKQPYDGLGVGMSVSPGLPQGDYVVDLQARAAVLDFVYTSTGSADVVLGNGTDQLLWDRLASCDGMNCTVTSAWKRYAVNLAQTALPVLELELDAGDCVTGALWLDDLRVRRAGGTRVEVFGVESACP